MHFWKAHQVMGTSGAEPHLIWINSRFKTSRQLKTVKLFTGTWDSGTFLDIRLLYIDYKTGNQG